MPDLGVVIPFYNEERTAGPVVRDLMAALSASGLEYEVALVADGSTDGTMAVLRDAAGGDPRVLIVCEDEAAGYGAAILHGLRLLKADIVGWTDGDGQVPPETVVQVHATMVAHGAKVGMGVRAGRRDGLMRVIASRGYNHLMRATLGFKFHDINAKPKLIERRFLETIGPAAKDWFVDTEIVSGALLRGASIVRVPVPFLARVHGASKVRMSILWEYWRNLRSHRRRLRREGVLGRPMSVVRLASPAGQAEADERRGSAED